ncbi:helix-turn-helix transcriptional regulator [Streptomyces sp. NBS 14/10]|uniref:helix-turn-helix domain-containing protein n=1 Tax=Streptomyces sp. NBS 14/10 TaxID=1945643 RepID=UPI00211AE7FE|nr:helix-turn-helix transcriptional regulator [Streptomyces sp. NBS 14/10]KAK1176686.1 helix-turn-helix transcriptional regulator [Streptomyces sp. NBS 14/10]
MAATMSTLEMLRLTVTTLIQRTGEQQRDLAAGIGLSPTQVSRKQNGQRAWSLDDCDLVAAYYEMPVLDLLAGPTHAALKLPAHRLAATLGGSQTLLAVPDTSAAERPSRARTLAPETFAAAPAPEAPEPAPQRREQPAMTAPDPELALEPDQGADGRAILGPAEPCVLCGKASVYRAGGRPQHLGGMCATVGPASVDNQLGHAQPAPATPPPAPAASVAGRRSNSGGSGAGNSVDELAAHVRKTVSRTLAEHGGDVEEATANLVKKAIPSVMEIFNLSRVGGRYDHSEFPPVSDILRKKSRNTADQIWEARPKWRNKEFLSAAESGTVAPVEVTGLDMNAAYLAAFKTYLPIGKLVHSDQGTHDSKRSGVYLLAEPPAWQHTGLPSPMGARNEPGPVWVTEPTLRLLLRCANMDLCEPPVIRESWTSGGTESLLEKMRRALAAVRKEAIENDDDVTTEYVKAMYSKFVSTIGESSTNRALRRTDWMHIIRSQAFSNLWLKAYKAHSAGLNVVQMSGTDELHVTGDWRQLWKEGRNLTEVKPKRVYTIGGKA